MFSDPAQPVRLFPPSVQPGSLGAPHEDLWKKTMIFVVGCRLPYSLLILLLLLLLLRSNTYHVKLVLQHIALLIPRYCYGALRVDHSRYYTLQAVL